MSRFAPLLCVAVLGCGSGLSLSEKDTGTATIGTTTGSSTNTTASSTTQTTGTTATGPWSHTVTVDGDLGDWTADEQFPIDGGSAYISWDADALYIGIAHPDLVSGGPSHWVLIYLGDGVNGTQSGVTFNTQQPNLAAPVTHLIRWKADDSYNSLVSWSADTWNDTPQWLGSAGNAYAENEANQAVEFQLSRSLLGLNDRAVVHLSLIFEGAGSESSYAPSPENSFLSGEYDPDYTLLWDFALDSSAAPSSASTLP